MAWGFGNTAGVKQLGSYEQAKLKFEHTQPIRGRKEECRPLGSRRHFTDRTIKKNWRVVEDDAVGQWVVTYSADVWGKDRVEWFPDGKVWVGTGGYSNPTINSTINYSVSQNYGEITSYNGKPYFRTKDGKSYIMTYKGLMLEPTGQEKSEYGGIIAKVMRPTKPIQEYKYRANRKAMNAVRKRYAKFIDYGKAMLLIDNKLPEKEAPQQSWYYYCFTNSTWNKEATEKNRKRVFKLIDSFMESGDLELAYQAAVELGHAFGYRNNICEVSEWVNGFTALLKFRFKDEVFTAEPIEIGEAFYDRNAKYFA